MPQELILLVGGNPLPNYVAACALKEKLGIERVHLFYTVEVEDIKDNLQKCLKAKGFQCRESFIEDAASAESIRHACRDISPDSHLHYTGGTNSMAVHIYTVWRQKGVGEDQASYLYGQDDRLVTDVGTAIDSWAVQLDLDTLATLHDLEDCKPRELLSAEDAKEIAAKVLEDPGLADRLYKDVPASEKEFRQKPLQASAYGFSLNVPVVPGANKVEWPDRRVKAWRKFRLSDISRGRVHI